MSRDGASSEQSASPPEGPDEHASSTWLARRAAGLPVTAWLVAGLALAWFTYFRVRFVAGCDPPAYLLESLRLRGVPAGLALDESVPFPDALAPLCFVTRGDDVVSFFPPGYPTLLALAGPWGLELHLNALLGAGSALALFVLARRFASERVALGAMLAWVLSPLVFYGATQVMSDLAAASFVVFSLAALPSPTSGVLASSSPAARERTFSEDVRALRAGLLFGIAVGVRPAQLVSLPIVAWLCPRPRSLAGFAAGLALALGFWALLLRVSTGSYFPAYAQNAAELGGEAYLHQLAFFLWQLAAQHAPVMVLAIAGAILRPRVALPFLAWIASNLLFHALWNDPLALWWEARFALPSAAALVVLGAIGAEALAERFASQTVARLGTVALLGYGLWSVTVSPAVELHNTRFHETFADDARLVARLVPEGALVGAVDGSAPLRYYGEVESFHWCHAQAADLVLWALETERPLFAYLGADPARFPCMGTSDPRLVDVVFEPLRRLSTGDVLYRLSRRALITRIDVGAPAARALLLDGWGGDEGSGEESFAWILGTRARLALPPEAGDREVVLRLALDPFGPVAPLAFEVVQDGTVLSHTELTGGLQLVEARIPGGTARSALELVPSRALSPRELGFSDDPRPLSVEVRWIDVLPADVPR